MQATDMGLRSFHLLFIGLSVVLAGSMAAWAVEQFRVEHQGIFVVTAVAGVLAGCGLAAYGAVFQRKTRNL